MTEEQRIILAALARVERKLDDMETRLKYVEADVKRIKVEADVKRIKNEAKEGLNSN